MVKRCTQTGATITKHGIISKFSFFVRSGIQNKKNIVWENANVWHSKNKAKIFLRFFFNFHHITLIFCFFSVNYILLMTLTNLKLTFPVCTSVLVRVESSFFRIRYFTLPGFSDSCQSWQFSYFSI